MVTQIRDVLYHYTNSIGKNGILTKAEIWFSNRNDLRSDNSQHQRRLEQLESIWGKESKLSLFFRKLVEAEVYIACFCQTPNNEYLWNIYANDGGGCLEISIDFISELRDKYVLAAAKVKYSSPQQWRERIIDDAKKLENESRAIEDLEFIFEENNLSKNAGLIELIVQIYEELLTTKDIASDETEEIFEHEKEIRLIVIPSHYESHQAIRPFKDNNGKNRLALKLPLEQITKIYSSREFYNPIQYVDGPVKLGA